jgi:HD-GYP domain-containing protein (c-di-GMP phosphodiesterase class II)
MNMSLHRRLALRLGLGALVVSLLAGAATLYIEAERVDDTILSLATQEAAAFAERSPGSQSVEKEATVEALLKDLLSGHQTSHLGHFLMAEVYDPARHEVAQVSQGLPDVVEHQVDTNAHRFPKHNQPWYRKIISDEQVYLQVLIPLATADGQPAGTFEGVYHVSAEEVEAISSRVTGTVILVVLVVILTTLALYPIIITLNREQDKLSKELLKANLDTLAVLGSAIAKRDSDTHAHNFRVTLYALGLAERTGQKPADICELIKGSWLHDVGKIAISDSILLKPGKLDEAEFTIMKTHVQHGLDIVGQYDWLKGAAEVVGGHHEKWDGSGYPHGISGEAIPLNARIFALADVFDALTSRRPYKDALSPETALEIMAKGRGSHFDPTLFDLFTANVMADYQQFGGREDDRARVLLMKRGHPYFFEA